MHSPADTSPVRFVDDDGAAIQLGPKIASGGEGTVYEVAGDRGRVAKIYHRDAENRLPKLRGMLQAPPQDPHRARTGHVSFCWPERLMFDRTGACVGFVMPRLDRETHQPAAMYWNTDDRAAIAPAFTWKHLVVSAANIASLLELLHAQGHVFGDLNEENVLLNDRALATIVDCDSMQICDPLTQTIYRSAVGREAYISPERIDVTLADCDRGVTDDQWALGVLVFQMLMEGHHPTDGIGDPDERRARIQQGVFPLLGAAGCVPPKYSLPTRCLPPEIQQLFRRCFVDGHTVPNLRPSAAEWRAALTVAAASLRECGSSRQHFYAPHLSTCIWCEQKTLWSIDRFAPRATAALGAGTQIELPRTSHSTMSTTSARARRISTRRMTSARPWKSLMFGDYVAALLLVLAASSIPTRPTVFPPGRHDEVPPLLASTVLPASHIELLQPPPPAANVRAIMRWVEHPLDPLTERGSLAWAQPPKDAPPPHSDSVGGEPPTPSQALRPSSSGATSPGSPVLASERPPGPSPIDDLRRLVDDVSVQLTPRPDAVRRGTMVWSGPVTKNAPVTVANGDPLSGVISGDMFPGVPIIIEAITPQGLAVIEPPSPTNGFRRMVLRSSFSRHQAITITWRTP